MNTMLKKCTKKYVALFLICAVQVAFASSSSSSSSSSNRRQLPANSGPSSSAAASIINAIEDNPHKLFLDQTVALEKQVQVAIKILQDQKLSYDDELKAAVELSSQYSQVHNNYNRRCNLALDLKKKLDHLNLNLKDQSMRNGFKNNLQSVLVNAGQPTHKSLATADLSVWIEIFKSSMHKMPYSSLCRLYLDSGRLIKSNDETALSTDN